MENRMYISVIILLASDAQPKDNNTSVLLVRMNLFIFQLKKKEEERTETERNIYMKRNKLLLKD